MEEGTDSELGDPNHRQGQAYSKIPPTMGGVPALISVEPSIFNSHTCGERKQKAWRRNELCNGDKDVFLSGCVDLQGKEGEKGIFSAVKRKHWASENTSKQLLPVNASESSSVDGKEKLQDLRRYKTVSRAGTKVNFNGASSNKRKNMVGHGDLRPWTELPEGLLDLITKDLGMVDYIMFGCVCRCWKLYVAVNKKSFMASQAPLILLLSPWAKKSCYFFNPFDHKISKAIFPSLMGKTCVGITGGYLVMENKNYNVVNRVWLVNPVTRHELHFPSAPNPLDRVFLASLSLPKGDFIIVGFSMFPPYLQFCRSTDDSWTVSIIEIPGDLRHWHFIDGTFFEGKIYFLTNDGEIVQFDPRSPPFYNILEVQSIPNPTLFMQLVASDNRLLVVKSEINALDYTVYGLDPSMKKWTEVGNLEDKTLFLSDQESNLVSCSKTKWESGKNARNCIYHLGYFREGTFVRSLDDGSTKWVAIEAKGGMATGRATKAFWYFPQLACNVDILVQ